MYGKGCHVILCVEQQIEQRTKVRTTCRISWSNQHVDHNKALENHISHGPLTGGRQCTKLIKFWQLLALATISPGTKSFIKIALCLSRSVIKITNAPSKATKI